MKTSRIFEQIISTLLKRNFFKSRRNLGATIGAILAALAGGYLVSDSQAKRPPHAGPHIAGKFDYFSMVLSWSPTYCAENSHDRNQCAPRRKYSFVVHGLWPQYNRGWPQDCKVPRDQMYVSDKIIKAMLDIMPSKRLIIHEWKKHGTCAGISQKKYFSATRALFKKIKIPPRYKQPNSIITTSPKRLKQEFVQANNWLKTNMMSIQCGNRRDRGRLREIRFCFDKKGRPASCGHNERRECRAVKLVLPPVR